MKTRLLMRSCLAAITMLVLGVSLAVASPAHALLGLPGTSETNLSTIFTNQGVPGLLSKAGCPVAKALPSNEVDDSLSEVVCAVGVLNYAYRTTYISSSGAKKTTITRALAGVPTPLIVDGGLLPEMLGTITPSINTSGVGLNVDITRLPTLAAGAKVSVEAILLDPAAQNTYVGVGEDGTQSGTDLEWDATVSLVSISSASTQIGITLGSAGAPASVGTIAEVFSGTDPDTPTSQTSGNLSFAPAPAALTAALTFGNQSDEVKLSTTSATTATATLAQRSGISATGAATDESDVTAVLDQLPTTADVTVAEAGATTVSYTGSATIGQLSATYKRYHQGALQTSAVVGASSVPTGLTFSQAGSQTSLTTSGGAIGSVTVGYGSGYDVTVPALLPGGSFVTYAQTSTTTVARARISNVTGVSFNGQPMSGTLTTTSPQTVSLKASLASGMTLSSTIDQLPASLSFSMPTIAGGGQQINYTASSAIGTITVDGSNIALPPATTNFHAEIDSLPARLTLNLPSSGTISLNTYGAHIEHVLAYTYSGSAPVVGSNQQLTYDVRDNYAAVRLNNVGSFSLTPGSNPFAVSYDVAPTPLTLTYIGPKRTVTIFGSTFTVASDQVTATISNPEPASVSLTEDGNGNTRAIYNVNSSSSNFTGDGSINQIGLTYSTASSYDQVSVQHVPANLDVCLQGQHAANTCVASWVPAHLPGSDGNETRFGANTAFWLHPTNLQGHLPTTPMVVNGLICPTESTPSACTGGDSTDTDPEHISITNLGVYGLEAAYGSRRNSGCTIACGEVWAAFNTPGPTINGVQGPITGDVSYYPDGSSDPELEYNATGGSEFGAQDKFIWDDWHAVDPLYNYTSSGSLECSGSPHLDFNDYISLDLLSGTFGVC